MKGLLRGELSEAQLERKRLCIQTERCAKTICFGDAFSYLETKSFINFPLFSE
jgi:hypothetical protein